MDHQLINQDSGNQEYYSPLQVLDLARQVLGTIDLDPASCSTANINVGAKQFYTKEDDGLSKPWHGNVWMNHPFSKGEKSCRAKCGKKKCGYRGHCITQDIPGNGIWTNKLVSEYQLGNVTEAICITFASMSEKWMQPLIPFAQCFPVGRINYVQQNGAILRGVTKGSVITYIGPNEDKFREIFSQLGQVKK